MENVLITGGTGSFGTACAKALLEKEEITRLVLFARGEHRHQQLAEELNDPRIRSFVGDVRDINRLRTALSEIDIVIHAAALKVVPLCEYNPFECVQTNILGAQNVIQASLEAGAKRVIALSTDKACAPVNLYGATKKAAESLFVAANNTSGGLATRFSVVRYGNVANSVGSVIPCWQHLAEMGEKLPVTDRNMTRFWMTLERAVRFVLKCVEDMQGGEIFIPKLPSFNVIALAEAFHRAYRASWKVTGIRPGEKLHESLIGIDEQNVRRVTNSYLIAPTIQYAHQAEYPGVMMPPNTEYRSDQNPNFLTLGELTTYVDALK